MCFTWTHLAQSILWDTCWVNGIFLIFIDPGRGRSFHTGLSLGRVGFHGSQAGNISSRMLCLSEASFLFSALTNTLPSIRWAVTLPLLADPHSPSLFCHLFVCSLFSSLSIWNIPAVVHDSGQSERVLRFDASPRCGLSRREGQAGMGEGAGGGKEERSQTHRDGKTVSKQVHKMRSS